MSTPKTRKKHSPEEVVRKLQQADKLLAEDKTVPEVCWQLEVAEPTYYKLRKQYAGMSVEDARELKALRDENAKLKRLVAEAELEKLALKEIAKDAPIDVKWRESSRSRLAGPETLHGRGIA